ncbi:hypothetical protein Scep_030904 [Stephania cephalantha]|uniref:Uncharacterized protein n=1 Tax=Stephania cephalantha TaxID=152367 RepID=A0AAP0HDK4_9MAGN
MSNSNKSSQSSSSSIALDPLLKDLCERKQSFRRSIATLAAELKDARGKLVLREESIAREAETRQVAERRAVEMEVEMLRLEKRLEEKSEQLKESACNAEMYLKELEDVRLQLSAAKATADEQASSAHSAQLKCSALLEEINGKNISLQECENYISKLGNQIDLLQKDSQIREASHRQLRDEVLSMEQEIMQMVAKAMASKNLELRRIMDDFSPNKFEEISKCLTAKNEEIFKLRDEMRIMAAQWKLVSKDFKSQLEKHHRTNQEMKKRILKLEFSLQEAQSETQKLLTMGERKDKVLKELGEQLSVMKQRGTFVINKTNFWESSYFKILVSMSMLIIVVFARR